MRRARESGRQARQTARTPTLEQRQYSAPRYYEIAFDMNRKQEVDFLVHCFRRYARRPVERVLDIACGTGPHLIRLAERGYRMSGLDLSPENIDFLRERAAQKRLDVELLVADMTRFRLRRPVDAVICMQDSQGHLLTNEAILAHLRCTRRALSPGGLYVFDRYMCSSWTDPARRWSWTRRRGRATVRATFEALKDINPVTQVFSEDMELEVFENGAREIYRQRHSSRMVFPQELRSLVELAGGFELCEWFYGFKPHLRLDTAHHPLLMVVVLRRSGGAGSRRGPAR
jgi:SAM-dependent methyltransferase